MKNNSYIEYTIHNVHGQVLSKGFVPTTEADNAIVRAFKAYREACYVTSREVTIEDEEPKEGSSSSSFIEATLWSREGDFIMRVFFPSEEDYEAEIASLMKACPSAVSVSVREVQ